MGKKISLLFLALVVVLFICSCELFSDFEEKGGKVWIVVYGNTYENSGPFPTDEGKALYASRLYGTVNDAVQVGNALVEWARTTKKKYDATYLIGKETRFVGDPLYGYQERIVGYPVEESNECCRVCVMDSTGDTSLESFRLCMDRISMLSSPGDMAIVFFSGHGFRKDDCKVVFGEDVSKNGMLVFSDNKGSNLEVLTCSDLISYARGISGTKIILGDFCYAGSLVQSNGLSMNRSSYEGGVGEFFSLLTSNVTEESSVFCVGACEYYKTSSEIRESAHGLFTIGLLEALGWDEKKQHIDGRQNEICLSEVCRIINENNKKKNVQQCVANGGSNDVVMFRKR